MLNGALYLLLLLAGTLRLRNRWSLIASFQGLPGVLFCLGIALFFATWVNFGLYFVLGWGRAYVWSTWAALIAWLVFTERWGGGTLGGLEGGARLAAKPVPLKIQWGLPRGEWLFFGFFLLLVTSRFVAGLDRGADGNLWCNFNFVDTAFHLSVVNSLLAQPHFPPIDLDMAPAPLKYHFLADFFVAHLHRLGMPPLKAMWIMNIFSSAALVGAIWTCFKRWLRLPPGWVLLAGLIFLFLNTSLINLVHFVVLNPPFFRVQAPVDGIALFPFFNFEGSMTNLFEPQRGLLFAFPVLLLVLDLAYGRRRAQPAEDAGAVLPTGRDDEDNGGRVLAAFVLICLLPFAHIVGFAVLAAALVPVLWTFRREFFQRWRWWVPVFVIGLLQLWYILLHGPAVNPDFSEWDASARIPLGNFAMFPGWSRRVVFWFFVNGDFFGWSLVFILSAVFAGGWRNRPVQAWQGLWNFLLQWRGFLIVCLGFFVLINSYRYSFFWGDSNKFVLFLNLGLSLVITLGAARWRSGDGRAFSRLLWLFLFALCVTPSVYEFHRDLVANAPGKLLLFNRHEQSAAGWLRANRQREDVVLTAAYNVFHFVTSLSGSPTRAGIYGDSNPHRVKGRREDIQLVYENNDLKALRRLDVRYICLSRGERRSYKLHPRWNERATNREAVVFSSGAMEDQGSVFFFDTRQLPDPPADVQ